MKPNAQSWVLRRVASTRLPTIWGEFQTYGYDGELCDGSRPRESLVVLVMGKMEGRVPLLRIHSQCITGDVLGSLRCDCGKQLEMALRMIASEACGLLIYEHQEGRGIGLMPKLRSYGLQDAGLDTVEANHALGFPTDCRDFCLPIAILRDLGISRVRLLSNNPDKSRALTDGGIEVVAQVSCEVPPTRHSLAYLRAKKQKMGHALNLSRSEGIHPFATIDAALRDLRAGRMIVVVDDEDRENEGDLVMSAEWITPEAINFMATHGRGLICLAMTGERLDELELGPMAPRNTALGGTAFTASIDARGRGMSTGISARDRAQTILAAIDSRNGAEDFARPGHVFPLRSRDGGVLQRRGHTEAAVDLARLTGLQPAGVICEILNEDGSMARVQDLVLFCRRHALRMITIADLATYRLARKGVEPLEAMEMPVPTFALRAGVD